MKKVGILTYFGDLNSGTNMQAFCIRKILQDKYGDSCNIEIINYHAWRKYWHPYLISISIRSLINDLKRIRKYKKFISENISPLGYKIVDKDPDPVWKYIISQSFDAIYVGSDTLLELDRYDREEISAFWLPAEIKARKILIAASAKNLDYKDLSVFQKKHIEKSISDTSLVGVRDKSTYELIRNVIHDNGPEIEIVPDPTFSYDIDYIYVEQYLTKRGIELEKPIACLHMMRNFHFSKDLAHKLKMKGYQIASFRPGPYVDILLNDMSPLELIGIFRYFKITITHRFHDAIFSLKNLTPVILIVPNKSYENINGETKFSCLLEEFDLKDSNLIDDPENVNLDDLIYKIDNAIEIFDKDQVKLKLLKMKNRFIDFADRSVKLWINS